jgi:hypothetical protein
MSGRPAAVTTGRDIVGREAELAALHEFLERAEPTPAAIILDGEPGIGKSALWLAGVEHALARGLRVLSSRPEETEYDLAHVGLGDPFEDILDEVVPTPTRAGARRWATRGPQELPKRAETPGISHSSESAVCSTFSGWPRSAEAPGDDLNQLPPRGREGSTPSPALSKPSRVSLS